MTTPWSPPVPAGTLLVTIPPVPKVESKLPFDVSRAKAFTVDDDVLCSPVTTMFPLGGTAMPLITSSTAVPPLSVCEGGTWTYLQQIPFLA